MEGKMEEYSDEKVERFSFLKPWVWKEYEAMKNECECVSWEKSCFRGNRKYFNSKRDLSQGDQGFSGK
jgi:hypothetical protein